MYLSCFSTPPWFRKCCWFWDKCLLSSNLVEAAVIACLVFSYLGENLYNINLVLNSDFDSHEMSYLMIYAIKVEILNCTVCRSALLKLTNLFVIVQGPWYYILHLIVCEILCVGYDTTLKNYVDGRWPFMKIWCKRIWMLLYFGVKHNILKHLIRTQIMSSFQFDQ